MTPIETIAVLLAVLTLVKLAVILRNPKGWMPVVDTVYKNPSGMMIVGLVISAVTGYYLLQVMNIVVIFAVMGFLAGLMIVSYAAYAKEMHTMAKNLLKQKGLVSRAWLSILIWGALSLWVLKEVFF